MHTVKSINGILLSSFELKAILLITLVKTLCLSHLNLGCVFSISLFSTNSLRSSLTLSELIFFFFK